MKKTFRNSITRHLLQALCLAVLSLSIAPCIKAQPLHRHTQSLPATDALGRKLPTNKEVGNPREDRFVGMFYWTWHSEFGTKNNPNDVTKFLKQYPEAISDYDHPKWNTKAQCFFWGEPLMGYYLNTDEWVLRKHAEMLGEAGVDVVVFDCTNGGWTWKESYMKLCEVFTKVRKEGMKTPQIAFMMAFAPTPESRGAIKEIYNDLYKPSKYHDLWFYWKGKPLIMGYEEGLPDEIRQFFTFRPGQPLYKGGPTRKDHWGWLEIYPQNGYVRNGNGGFEQMPVGVAQNWTASNGLSAMNAPGAFGRSYTHAKGHSTEADATARGLNFQEQWEHALKADPEFIFITGWNEWIAGRHKEWQGLENAFPDQFSQEFSRDIEPMKGGHGDNYYYQMIANIRRFKGMPKENGVVAQTAQTIDWNFWTSCTDVFGTHKGNTFHRDWPGWVGTHQNNTTGRNDFVEAKVAHTKKELHFYMRCRNKITPYTDKAWMRLFIDIDRKHSTGWEGYDFIINRLQPSVSKAKIEKHCGANWSWESAGKVKYQVYDNAIFLTIPKHILGINTEEPFNLEFKWADNTQEDGNIMDFIINGDVAPMGRFNYVFQGE